MWLVWVDIGFIVSVIMVAGIVSFIEDNKRQDIWEETQRICEAISNRFSLTKYYEDIDRAVCEIQVEREREEEYEITLWLGLDGLCLHKDGTLEWVSKRKNNAFAHVGPWQTGSLKGCREYICALSMISELQMFGQQTKLERVRQKLMDDFIQSLKTHDE